MLHNPNFIADPDIDHYRQPLARFDPRDPLFPVETVLYVETEPNDKHIFTFDLRDERSGSGVTRRVLLRNSNTPLEGRRIIPYELYVDGDGILAIDRKFHLASGDPVLEKVSFTVIRLWSNLYDFSTPVPEIEDAFSGPRSFGELD